MKVRHEINQRRKVSSCLIWMLISRKLKTQSSDRDVKRSEEESLDVRSFVKFTLDSSSTFKNY